VGSGKGIALSWPPPERGSGASRAPIFDVIFERKPRKLPPSRKKKIRKADLEDAFPRFPRGATDPAHQKRTLGKRIQSPRKKGTQRKDKRRNERRGNMKNPPHMDLPPVADTESKRKRGTLTEGEFRQEKKKTRLAQSATRIPGKEARRKAYLGPNFFALGTQPFVRDWTRSSKEDVRRIAGARSGAAVKEWRLWSADMQLMAVSEKKGKR